MSLPSVLAHSVQPFASDTLLKLVEELDNVVPATTIPRYYINTQHPLLMLRSYVNGLTWLDKNQLRSYVLDYLGFLGKPVKDWSVCSTLSYLRHTKSVRLSNWHVAYLIHKHNDILSEPNSQFRVIDSIDSKVDEKKDTE